MNICQAVSEEDTRHLLETIIEDVEAPSPNDAARAKPSALRHTIYCNPDARLADAVSTSEIMVLDLYRKGHLSQKTGQILLDMTRHQHFVEVRSQRYLQRHHYTPAQAT
jgi:hypothetical protein